MYIMYIVVVVVVGSSSSNKVSSLSRPSRTLVKTVAKTLVKLVVGPLSRH